MCPDTRASAYVSVYDLVYSVCATLYTLYFRAVQVSLYSAFALTAHEKTRAQNVCSVAQSCKPGL